MEDLIEEYINIIRDFTDAPDIFLQTCSYHIISTVLGQYFEILDAKIERPNLWFILSSVPGRTRRSTVSRFNEYIISSAFTKFYEENENLSRRESQLKYNLSRIIDGSTEGIADAVMHGENEGINTFNVCNPEIGDVLRKISKGQSGTQGLDTLLSRLYYGEPYYASFSQRVRNPQNRYFSAGKYVTMFSTMQEPQYYLNKTMSRQGLLRRILLVYVDAKDLSMDKWKSPFEDSLHQYRKRLDDYVENQLFPKMKKYYKSWKNYNENLNYTRYIPVNIKDNVKEEISKIAREIDEEIIEDDSDYNIYQQTKWENLIKMTVVSAIARNPLKGKEEINLWEITASYEDYQRAKNIIDEIDKHTEQILDKLGTYEIQAKRDKGIDRVYKQIYRVGKKGIIRSDLLNNLYGIKARELDEYVETLSEADKIKILRPESKKATKYIATCYM